MDISETVEAMMFVMSAMAWMNHHKNEQLKVLPRCVFEGEVDALA